MVRAFAPRTYAHPLRANDIRLPFAAQNVSMKMNETGVLR